MTVTEPIYCTTAQLKGELEAQSAAVPDANGLKRVIEQAEDLIDSVLGGWFWGPNQETGRKITQGDVMPYQWTKLGRATMLLAARLYTQPDVLQQFYTSVSGPDFSMSGPNGGPLNRLFGVHVIAVLEESGLRRLTGRARAGRGIRHRPDFDRFLTATRHDGT